MVAACFNIVFELATAHAEELPYAWVEGGAILGAVLIVSMVTAVNDYQK